MSIENDEKSLGFDVLHLSPSDDSDDRLKLTRSYPSFKDIDDGFDPVEVKRLTRKIDLRIVPILSAMYSISLIDRNNVSLARQANNMAMQHALGLGVGMRFSIITLVFFLTYIVCELPSQLGLRRFGPRWWLGTAVLLWGIVMITMTFATHWTHLVVQRLLLGMFESCLLPGAAYLVACWYPRRNMASRNSIFFTVSCVMAGLAGIMTWGFSHLDGKRGLAGWQWIFLLCGVLTVLVAILTYLGIEDFPDCATFLTEAERHVVTTRIQRDRADADADKLDLHKIATYAKDPKIWIWGYCFCCGTMGGYSLAFFQPRILASMGFSNALSQILICPPQIWMMIQTIALAFLADRTKWRSQVVIFNALVMITGTMVYSQLPMSQKGARYFGVFLACAGSNGTAPLILSWSQANIRAQSKRAFTSAVVIAFGGVGGIIAAVAFKESEATRGYPTGVWLTVAMNGLMVVAAAGLKVYMMRANRRADRGLTVLEGHEGFRYQ